MTLCPSTSRSPRIAEGGVIVQDIGDGSCYAHVGLRLMGSSPASIRPPSPRCDYHGGFAPQLEQRPESLLTPSATHARRSEAEPR